jgi:hypothetical protein
VKLITEALKRRFAKVGRQDDKEENVIVIAKFFTPDSSWTWFALEYEEETNVCFGFVIGPFPELGYFSIEELEGVRGLLGLPVERDLYWTEKSLAAAKTEAGLTV